jgi:hypothetical protein
MRQFAICIFLLKAHIIVSDAPTIYFHHLSFCLMAMLEDRPEDVLDACQPDLQVDLVTSLTAASALQESKVLAEEMEPLSFVNGLYWTKDGKMWVPNDLDLRFDVFLYCHASVLGGQLGRDQTDDKLNSNFIGRVCLWILRSLCRNVMCAK